MLLLRGSVVKRRTCILISQGQDRIFASTSTSEHSASILVLTLNIDDGKMGRRTQEERGSPPAFMRQVEIDLDEVYFANVANPQWTYVPA